MSIKLGRTIGEQREKLETASERAATHRKNEKKKRFRLIFTIIGFILALGLGIGAIVFLFLNAPTNEDPEPAVTPIVYTPTIEIVDEGAAAVTGGGGVTSRMKEYIGQAEADFHELNYNPVKAVIPAGSVREVDFYLEGYKGFIKLIIDRPTGVSVEDADRMLRYLAGQGVTDFTYIDVRIEGKAYWK